VLNLSLLSLLLQANDVLVLVLVRRDVDAPHLRILLLDLLQSFQFALLVPLDHHLLEHKEVVYHQ
jgi:hypothetical protein